MTSTNNLKDKVHTAVVWELVTLGGFQTKYATKLDAGDDLHPAHALQLKQTKYALMHTVIDPEGAQRDTYYNSTVKFKPGCTGLGDYLYRGDLLMRFGAVTT